MTNKTCHPTHITQTDGGKYCTFNNINNAKTVDNKYAQTTLINGKTSNYNRPSTVTVDRFWCKIPTGAKITKITVLYKHSKAEGETTGKTPNITAPTISLMNGTKVMKFTTGTPMSKTGKAPSTTPTEEEVVFNSIWDSTTINSTNFGVKIDYPTNANENNGYVRLYHIKVIVTYTPANFQVNVAKITGQYNYDDYEIEYTLNNVNKVNYNPTVGIEIPSGFSLKGYTGDGTLTTISARTFEWATNIKNKTQNTLKITCTANITYSSGQTSYTGTFTGVESVANHTGTKTVTVLKDKPVDPYIDPDPDETTIENEDLEPENNKIVFLKMTEETNINLQFTDEEIETWATSGARKVCYMGFYEDDDFDRTDFTTTDAYVKRYYSNTQQWVNLKGIAIMDNDLDSDGNWNDLFKLADTATTYETPRNITICIYTDNYGTGTLLRKIHIQGYRDDLTAPNMSILTLSNEELNRLGDGYVYTLQTYLKENTSEDYVRDWDKNFRLGVFNNAIETNVKNITYTDDEGETQEITYDSTDYNSLTPTEIYQNAEFWSEAITDVNTFTDLTCEFRYSEQYPLYIIITGDYSEATTPASITYAEPEIIENYEEPLINGLYPVPINNIVSNDGNSTEVTIPAFNTTETIVLYNLPLDEGYGTDENIAVRGLQLNATFQQNTPNLVLYASLVNSQNESRTRSIVLDTVDDNNEIHLGQIGDLWGFSTLDITELEDWEIHLTLSNALNDDIGTANFGDLSLTIYNETIDHQANKCYINGEDLSYYGVFITDVKIPEGLKTDTKFITIDGTDTNDPYLQKIKEKTIEVEFEIGDNCDLEGATLSLRELARLLTNKRDQYNRPIPKRIEFSHYPDVYWEYIMEEPLDNEVNISSYTCKAKLTIPSGTSYDKEPTITNTTGYISGLAYVSPVIELLPTDNSIEITERYSGQSFNLTLDELGFWSVESITIDCNNRTAIFNRQNVDNPVEDIAKNVDYNSDWFVLHGEFEFQATGCVIKSITYKERW